VKRLVALVVGLSLIATVTVVAVPLMAANPSSRTLLAGSTLAGVSGIYVGSANPLRGIAGGGFPWVISEGRFQLKANGEFEVDVQGLVIDPSNATAQAKGIAGVNPLPFFFATLSCTDNTGATTNVNTGTFPATSTGNAMIDQTISLPASCFAPLVFVRGSASGSSVGPWFAVSGY
jgi:hypothetical protein